DYHIAVDGFAGATGNASISWDLMETADDLPEVVEDAGELGPGGNRRIVADEGDAVELRVLGFGVSLSFKWFHNGVRIPRADGPIHVIDSLNADTVGEYQAEAANQNGQHKIRSKTFLVEIGADRNANTENKVQNLDRRQGQQGLSGYRRPQNLIPVSG
ncbi:MAG: hypothetical protein ACKVHO_25700, partial [Verrucomicrobiia bacterium]